VARLRAFGDTAAPPPAAAPPLEPPKKPPPALLLVGVAARRPDGGVTRLALPGPLEGSRVPYLFKTVDGSWMTGAFVTSTGEVQRLDLGQPDPAPGTRLSAVMDPRGRVLCIQEGRPSRKRTETKRRSARSVERPDPGELLIAGAAGRVLGVR
jgi:hypothetical protein